MADLEAPAIPEPAAPAPAEPQAPEPVAAAPEPEGDDIPEGAIEQSGQVMVPLAALRAEREQTKALKGKALQFDQAAQYLNQVKPYIDFLQANPDLMSRREATAPAAPVAPEPQDDPELQDLARTLDLYTTEGKPDVVRAKKLEDRLRQSARAEAQTVVKPVQEHTLQERAVANFHQAAESTLPNGAKVDRNMLWQIWQKGDAKVLSTPEGAAAAWMLAYGMQSANAQPTIQPPAQPPVVTEGTGSRFVNRAPLTDMDQRVIQVRGMDPKRYAEHAKAFRPGEVNTIEE